MRAKENAKHGNRAGYNEYLCRLRDQKYDAEVDKKVRRPRATPIIVQKANSLRAGFLAARSRASVAAAAPPLAARARLLGRRQARARAAPRRDARSLRPDSGRCCAAGTYWRSAPM